MSISHIAFIMAMVHKHKSLKELNYLNLRKVRLQLWKESENLKEVLKALGCSKTIICNYVKSPNKYGIRKPTGRPEKLSPQFKRRIVCEVKKKTLSTSKILKSLVDAPCSTRTIRRHLNTEKIKHKKRIHCPRLTMKQKEKWMKYAHQYPIMSAKEWQKVDFPDKKNSIYAVQIAFRSTGTQRKLSEENYSTRHSGGDCLWSGGGGFSSSGKLKLQFVSGRQKAADYVKMVNDLSLTREERRLCGKE